MLNVTRDIAKPRKQLPKGIRIEVWRDNNPKQYEAKCFVGCGKDITDDMFHCSHIISVYNGGNDDKENLRPACQLCNTSMGSMNMTDFILQYKRYKSRLFDDRQIFDENRQINHEYIKTLMTNNGNKNIDTVVNTKVKNGKAIKNIKTARDTQNKIVEVAKDIEDNHLCEDDKCKVECDDKPHKCHKCPKTFKLKADLERHFRRKFSCDRKVALKDAINCNLIKEDQNSENLINDDYDGYGDDGGGDNDDGGDDDNGGDNDCKEDTIDINIKNIGTAKKLTCKYCHTGSSRSDNLKRHMETCKFKNNPLPNIIKDNSTTNEGKAIIRVKKMVKEISKDNKVCKLMVEEISKDNKARKVVIDEISKDNKICNEMSKNESFINIFKKSEIFKEIVKEGIASGMSKEINNKNRKSYQNKYNLIEINDEDCMGLVAFGSEDLSHISDESYKKILQQGVEFIPAFIKLVHFNEEVFKNNNIYTSNIRDSNVRLFDGIDWVLEDRDRTLQTLFDNTVNILKSKYKKLQKTLDNATKIGFTKFISEKDDPTVNKDIKKRMQLTLYNKRKINNQNLK